MFDLPPATAAAMPAFDAQVVAAAAGDRVAFGRLYDTFAPMVHGVLLARAPRADVDDLVQDVFLQAMRRIRSLRDPSAFGPMRSRRSPATGRATTTGATSARPTCPTTWPALLRHDTEALARCWRRSVACPTRIARRSSSGSSRA